MMVAIKPAMKWVERRCSPRRNTGGDETYICLTLGGVLAAGFISDLIGIHAIFGAFIFGLTIPKGGDLGRRLMERIEDFVSGLLLPLYFASSGLKTNVAKIKGGEAWGLLALAITTACTGKIIGTFAAAMLCMIPVRESITLGVLMNTKGLVELIVLNIGREKKVLNDEAFTILVLMALFTTFLTTPTVKAIYQPASRAATAAGDRCLQSVSHGEFRILACVHGPANIPSLLSLIESTRSPNQSSSFLKLYVMNMVQLTDRSSSIVMVQRFRKNGFPFINRLLPGTHLAHRVAIAFQANSQLSRVSVRPATAISALETMHEDIGHVAEEKAVAMIVLPFHNQWRKIDGEEEVVESIGHGWREVNQRVLKAAPCTVAVLVDRGYGGNLTAVQNVCVLLLGGEDDREALELGGRMAEHPVVQVAVVRFIDNHGIISKENERGGPAELMSRVEGKVEMIEKIGSGVVDEAIAIGRSGDYDLIIVGKECPGSSGMGMAVVEHPELGPIGNALASSGQGIAASVLVVQRCVAKSRLGEDGIGHDQK